MSLEKFIYCPCKHALEVHGERGCAACACHCGQREVIDRLLEFERDAIHRTWLGGAAESRADAARAVR